MAKTSAFEKHASDYDQWFEDHRHVYQSELEALKKLLPESGKGMEVGVGTGRFAAPLGIKTGVEPSQAMREIARNKNIDAMDGTAEALPFPDEHFDYVLFVTTVCFLDSLEQAFKEAFRVLKSNGAVMIGMIDRDSQLGQEYDARKKESRFYKEAVFRSVDEVVSGLENSGFGGFQFVETLRYPTAEIMKKEPVQEGYGEGAFVVVKAVK
ncbi:class I SAM-dependent methyltransferase [Pontiella sulfatireligans]|uniref:Methyltransferase type 11 domain-containing protein n=1 Tax=Pontiella sulfatireligans TaxID=2750658 RepID=A0A6C2UIY8_9BACT|nr:class I SAM-dependent methyltransferase [Pontiella sulfatireligans]VGO19919.1 hypothetical protein SCARR_01979 [Pontiella sulfatireligans]